LAGFRRAERDSTGRRSRRAHHFSNILMKLPVIHFLIDEIFVTALPGSLTKSFMIRFAGIPDLRGLLPVSIPRPNCIGLVLPSRALARIFMRPVSTWSMGCVGSGARSVCLGVKCFITSSGVLGVDVEYVDGAAGVVRAPPTGPMYLLKVFTFLPRRSE